VLETCSGLVTGAVAERLGGFGRVCTTYLGGKCPPLEATRMLNFSDHIKQSMSTASLATLLQYQAQPAEDEAPVSNGVAGLEQAAAEQTDGQNNWQHDGQLVQQQEAAMPGEPSLQNQQVAEMNGAQMRGLLDAGSEQPQATVVAGLSSTAQTQPGLVSGSCCMHAMYQSTDV